MSTNQNKRLCFFTAHELLHGYRSRTISPVDVIKDVLKRIEQVNNRVNAYCFVEDHDILIEQAKKSEGSFY